MRNRVIVSTLGIILLLIVSIFICYETNASKQISLPDSKSISCIEILSDSNIKSLEDIHEIEKAIEYLSNSKLTKKQSVQDVPLVNDYITISLILKNEDIIILYVYQEKEKWFAELPYQGIYEIENSSSFSSYLEKY